MIKENFKEDLEIALKSEVLGEAFFRSAYYATFFGNRRYKAKMLWQLETQTKTIILEYFAANKIEIPKPRWTREYSADRNTSTRQYLFLN